MSTDSKSFSTILLLVSLFASLIAGLLKAQTITHVPLYTINGDNLGDQLGRSVSGAGDVDGDGKADLIIAIPFTDSFRGIARVVSGSDGSVLYNFDGDKANDRFGTSVSGAGDVNGDGRADLIVGAPATRSRNGSARVLSGSDGSILFNFDADSEDDRFGQSVSGVGDVNGDGRADLIVGAPDDRITRVFSGSDGSVLHSFTGGRSFGGAVSGAGDINGDGTPDLIVGAELDSPNGTWSGSARVLSGSDGSVIYNFDGDSGSNFFGVAVSGAGDVNGDGASDLIVGAVGVSNSTGSARVLSGIDGSVLYDFDGDSRNDSFGMSVGGAGDVNGDGTPDLIVGAHHDGNNGRQSGSVRVLSGSDGSVLYNFNGDSAGDWFGYSVSGAGDVNGDGINDFIAGAPFGGANAGGYARVFVSQILGDCNQDGAVNFLDISPFVSLLLTGDFLGQADTNEDGAVTFLDISSFIELLTSQT